MKLKGNIFKAIALIIIFLCSCALSYMYAGNIKDSIIITILVTVIAVLSCIIGFMHGMVRMMKEGENQRRG